MAKGRGIRWHQSKPSDATDSRPPKYLPGDPIISLDGEPGRIEFARHDGQCYIIWDHSGRHEWVHEECLTFAPGFAPVRRR